MQIKCSDNSIFFGRLYYMCHYCSGINGVCLGGCAADPTGDVHSCHMCVCVLLVRWLAGGCERKAHIENKIRTRVGIYLTSAEIGNPLLVWPGSSVRKWKDYSIS
jgi:hypothetical protein